VATLSRRRYRGGGTVRPEQGKLRGKIRAVRRGMISPSIEPERLEDPGEKGKNKPEEETAARLPDPNRRGEESGESENKRQSHEGPGPRKWK